MPIPLGLLAAAAAAAVAALALGGSKAEAAPAGGAPAGGAPPGPGQLPAFGVPPLGTVNPATLDVPGADPQNNPFDRLLTPKQVVAIKTALATEPDPAKLEKMAKDLLPEFPIASGALSAKAAAIRLAQGAGVPGVTPINLGLPAPTTVAPTPSPVATTAPGANATVTTHDTGPSGDLLVRALPNATAPVTGKNAHGSRVIVTGPAIAGFFPVAGAGGVGFSSASFLTLDAGAAPTPSPFPFPGGLVTPVGFPSLPTGVPPFPQIGSHAIVATTDTGPSGNLNLRASAPSGAVIGSNPHGAIVTITGPIASGFYPVVGPGGAGFSSAQFLAAEPKIFSAGLAGNPHAGRVVVTANLLGLRGQPDARAPYVAQASKGSSFQIAGPAQAGYLPIRDDAGNVAWASTIYLEGVHAPAQAAGNDIGAGPSTPFAELHMTALALKTALAAHGCRSYNEPLVKDFQRVAKRAGIYSGEVDGWYGTVTQAALSKIVGKPAPACFQEASGGPSNPNEYWSPMGV